MKNNQHYLKEKKKNNKTLVKGKHSLKHIKKTKIMKAGKDGLGKGQRYKGKRETLGATSGKSFESRDGRDRDIGNLDNTK